MFGPRPSQAIEKRGLLLYVQTTVPNVKMRSSLWHGVNVNFQVKPSQVRTREATRGIILTIAMPGRQYSRTDALNENLRTRYSEAHAEIGLHSQLPPLTHPLKATPPRASGTRWETDTYTKRPAFAFAACIDFTKEAQQSRPSDSYDPQNMSDMYMTPGPDTTSRPCPWKLLDQGKKIPQQSYLSLETQTLPAVLRIVSSRSLWYLSRKQQVPENIGKTMIKTAPFGPGVWRSNRT